MPQHACSKSRFAPSIPFVTQPTPKQAQDMTAQLESRTGRPRELPAWASAENATSPEVEKLVAQLQAAQSPTAQLDALQGLEVLTQWQSANQRELAQVGGLDLLVSLLASSPAVRAAALLVLSNITAQEDVASYAIQTAGCLDALLRLAPSEDITIENSVLAMRCLINLTSSTQLTGFTHQVAMSVLLIFGRLLVNCSTTRPTLLPHPPTM